MGILPHNSGTANTTRFAKLFRSPCKETPSDTDAYARLETHQLESVAFAILRVTFGHKPFQLPNLSIDELCLRSVSGEFYTSTAQLMAK